MRNVHAIALVLVLMGAVMSGCISTADSAQSPPNTLRSPSGTPHHPTTEQTGNGTSVPVGTAEINGTFSGFLTAPMGLFNETERFLEKMNTTLYAFEVKVIGENLNASITIYVLKLVPPFIPNGFNVTINAHPIEGPTFIPYAEKIPVSVEAKRGNNGVETTSYLEMKPQEVKKASGVCRRERLDELNGSTILTLDGLSLSVNVHEPGNYVFTVLCNGTEISSGGLTVG